jgi:fructose-bisphosphate aldolase, class II
MPLVPTASLVAQAQASGDGLAAFNVICLEHVEAVIAGAERAGRPVILQVSENALRFHNGVLAPLAQACAAAARASDVEVAMHLDHVKDLALLDQVMPWTFGSVMVDASSLPYEDNLALTRRTVAWAAQRGLWVEAELGQVGGKDGEPPLDAHAPGARTDPDEARSFVEATGVDALAVAVGSSHAMTEQTAVLDLELVARLRAAVPVPLVLHGSSGVPAATLSAAVATGIVKVNIGTALNVAFTGAVRARLAEDAGLVDPRRYLAPAREAMTDVVADAVRTLRAPARAT